MWSPSEISQVPPTPTHVKFDAFYPLIWSTSSTRLHSKYTKWKAGYDLRDVNTTQDCVLTLDKAGLTGWNRRGIKMWKYDGNYTHFLPHAGTTLLSSPDHLSLLSHSFQVLRQVDTPSPVSCMRTNSKGLLACAQMGVVSVRQTHSLAQLHSLPAHATSISDLDISNNYLVTCGHAKKAGQVYVENVVKVWDIRTWKPLPSLPTTLPPKFVRFIPGENNVIVTCQNMSWLEWDCSNGSPPLDMVVPSANFTIDMDISTNGQHLAFVDHAGYLYHYSRSNVGFNDLNGELEGVLPLDYTSIPDDAPLSAVGMPYYTTHLLSATSWPKEDTLTPRIKIPPEILASAKKKPNDVVAYAPNPGKIKRNQALVSVQDTPKFRSQTIVPLPSSRSSNIPPPWKKVEIQYSKFGVEDFDFAFYNKTKFSGLESHIDNSYCNAYLQLLFFTQPLRAVLKSHIKMQCYREFCLACELGFLFCMLEDGVGMNCQASNFLKSFGKKPQAQALGLLDHGIGANYVEMMHGFTRFLLDDVSLALDTCKPEPLRGDIVKDRSGTIMQQLYAIEASNHTKCLKCGLTTTKPTTPLVLDLMGKKKKFDEVLKASFARETWTKAWCETCHDYCSTQTTRKIANLPPVLGINCGDAEFWKEDNIATTLELGVEGENVVLVQGTTYDLLGIVFAVAETTSHLVSCIKIDDEWYIFNDFSVLPISEAEVFAKMEWKRPCHLIYVQRDWKQVVNLESLPQEVDYSILEFDPTAINRRKTNKDVALSMDQIKQLSGKLLAIDSEFVALTRDELEVRSDGTKVVVRPRRLGLARVSVVWGEGEFKGQPLIDDWILSGETVMDYLTEYSGIKPGDLDPGISTHTLVPLKSAYKKLRLLVDMKCRFVGHGLLKDFRIINILVPPDQVIDTVNLFYIPQRQRRVALRFLAWFLLQRDIQKEGMGHDSIEDARTALELWELWQDLKKEGKTQKVLESIYDQGKALSWKVV